MCGIVGSVVTLVVGAVLIVATTTFSYVFLPQIVDNVIEGEVTLISDTIQFERFQVQPFAVNFTIRLFNVTNVEDALAGGVPVVQEVGPYTYKLYQSREIESMTENTVSYRRVERFEFDPVSSFPNTEDDLVTIINVPYHEKCIKVDRFTFGGKFKFFGGNYVFEPFGVETLGPWGPGARSLFKELSKRLVDNTRDQRADLYLGQRISIAIQRGNAASLLGTFPQVNDAEEFFDALV